MNIIEAKSKLSETAKGRYNVVEERQIEFPSRINNRVFTVFIEGYGTGIGDTWEDAFADMHNAAQARIDKYIGGSL